jgi:hypothetical protein
LAKSDARLVELINGLPGTEWVLIQEETRAIGHDPVTFFNVNTKRDMSVAESAHTEVTSGTLRIVQGKES